MSRHVLVALLSPLIVAWAVPAIADQWEKNYPVTGRPTVVLRTDDAGVYVMSGTAKTVGLRVTTVGWTIGPRGIRVEARQAGDRIECEVREPRLMFQFGFHRRSVRIDVSVPREADLDIATSDGGVTLGPLSGLVRVRTSDGGIEAEGLRGELYLRTSDGHIRARGLDGTVEAHSSDGSMEIEGRFDRLDLSTSDGRIEASALPGSHVASGWSLRSSDGSQTLRVPRDLRADLDLRSGDGSVHLDLPVEVTGTVARHALRGRLNGGGALVEMRTSDGSIRVGAIATVSEPPPAPKPAAPARPKVRAGGKAPVRPARPVADTTGVEI